MSAIHEHSWHQSPMRYRALDGLRGTAALVVMFFHIHAIPQPAGLMGVMIFFMISGFLMGVLYIDTSWSPKNVLEFLRRRFARVMPLYLFIVIVSYTSIILFNYPILYKIDKLRLFIGHLLVVKGISALWTIPVEVQFYLLFPLIWLSFWLLGWRLATFLVILLSIFGLCSWVVPISWDLIHLVHYFCFGIVVAIVVSQMTNRSNITWDFGFFCSVLAIVLVFIQNTISGYSAYSAASATASIAVLFTCTQSKLAATILGGRIGHFFGEISYSIYLWHIPVMNFLLRTHFWSISDPWLFLVIYPGIVIAVSWASYRIVEKPARTWLTERQPRRDSIVSSTPQAA